MEIGTLRTSNVTMSSTVMNVIGGGGCCGSFDGGAGGAGGARGRGCVADVEDAGWKADTATTASSTTAPTIAAHTQGLLGNHVAFDSFPSTCDGMTSTSGLILVGGMTREGAAGCFGVLLSVPTDAVRPLSDKGIRGTVPIVPPKDTPLLLLLPAKLARSSNRSENSFPPALLLGMRRRVVCGGRVGTDIAQTRLVKTPRCRTNDQQTSVFNLQDSPVRPNDTHSPLYSSGSKSPSCTASSSAVGMFLESHRFMSSTR